jgi:Fe-S-cluster containining protein
MHSFEKFHTYFEECINCGDCCHLPGDLLPEQVDLLANHFGLDRRQFFDKYLVVQLFAPNEFLPPAFLATPVKADRSGNRSPHKMVDQAYMDIKHLECIFRDHASKACSIHDIKPLACAFLICSKCTRSNPVLLDWSFFYHHWIGAQHIIFSVYPELENIHKQLVETASKLSLLEKEKAKATEERNRLSQLALAAITGSPASR